MMAGRSWTREEDRSLRALAPRLSSTEIALQIGRSPDSIKHRARALGLSLAKFGDTHPMTRYSESAIEAARTLHDQGFGPRWIAKRLRINENTLRSALYYQQRRRA